MLTLRALIYHYLFAYQLSFLQSLLQFLTDGFLTQIMIRGWVVKKFVLWIFKWIIVYIMAPAQRHIMLSNFHVFRTVCCTSMRWFWHFSLLDGTCNNFLTLAWTLILLLVYCEHLSVKCSLMRFYRNFPDFNFSECRLEAVMLKLYETLPKKSSCKLKLQFYGWVIVYPSRGICFLRHSTSVIL